MFASQRGPPRTSLMALGPLACGALACLSFLACEAQAGWKSAPTLPRFDSAAKQETIATLKRGAALGNRADLLVKVGDSISEDPAFLQGIGCRRWKAGRRAGLGKAVRYFSARRLRGASSGCKPVNAFSRDSAATQSQQPSDWALKPSGSPDRACRPSETPLACEIRIVRPAYATVLFGTNDVSIGVFFHGSPLERFLANIGQIIATSQRLGVVPIISTLPPRADGAEARALTEELNAGLQRLARARRVPLVNLWRALDPLPNHGLSPDNLHPSIYGVGGAANFTPAGVRFGYNQLNLITMLTLQRLSRLERTVAARRTGRG